MTPDLYLVDAFVGDVERGNPAGVCILEGPADEAWMQEVADEMAQAETAFLYHDGEIWQLRWFTPVCEVDLCGHATLASAKVLFAKGLAQGEARFMTKSGELVCRQDGPLIELDFPAAPANECAVPGVLQGLVASSVWFGASPWDYMAILPDEASVRGFEPNMAAIASSGKRGFVITAQGEETDFCSRFFAPQSGVPEDHVTGSAHCTLTPYWADRLGKTEMSAAQLSRRGGILQVSLNGDRVSLKGRARIRVSGTLQP
jgi:predicted PhzF superfamily epimerase YddE/YHI9